MALTKKIADYELQRLLRQGGMAELWLARWRLGQARRLVAIKMLPLERCCERNLMQLLRREIAIAAALQHPSQVFTTAALAVVQLGPAACWRRRHHRIAGWPRSTWRHCRNLVTAKQQAFVALHSPGQSPGKTSIRLASSASE